MSMGKEVASALRMLRAFGLRSGARAYLPRLAAQLRRSQLNREARVSVPGLPEPLCLRPGQSDWQTLDDIFVRREYDTSFWPDLAAEVDCAYGAALASNRVPVIIDCGANIGFASIWFAIQYPRAVIFAIEPEPGNFAVLLKNTASFANIRPLRAAISDRIATVALVNTSGEPWAWQTRECADSGITTVTIDGLLARVARAVPLIVKVDIEGAEVDLFRSATGWVARTPLIVFELHDWLGGWRGTGHAVFSSLTRHRREYVQNRQSMFSFARVDAPANGGGG